MKILTIVENLGLGGTERVAQNFAIGYQNSNCETKVLATKSLGLRAEILATKNIEVFDGSKNLDACIQEINQWKPEIIHIHRPGYFNEMNGLLTALKNKDTKVIETNIFARPDYSASAHLVDAHLNLSNWCLWKWQQWTKGLHQLGVLMPNLIDCDQFIDHPQTAERSAHVQHLPQDAIILGRIGQALFAKWDEIIFKVLEELLQKSDKYYLVLVGLPDVLQQKLKTYSPKVQAHTLVIDPISNDKELNTLYQSFDIFLHAAQIGESFGMVLAEAHLNKVPIVTLNTPLKDNSQNEIVGHNRGGFVVSDQKHMVEAVELLAADTNLRAKFGQAGYQHILTHFERDTVSQKTLALCEILLKNLDRSQTIKALNEKDIKTHVPDTLINDLNNNIMGHVPLHQRFLLKILQNPIFYKNYLKYKGQ
jgi:glycosyltransferase involved in cell wall biosynthesis